MSDPSLTALGLATLAACGGDDSVQAPPAELTRSQGARAFTPVVEATFAALNDSVLDTDRRTGVLNNVAYRVEVRKTGWNGKLVM